MHRRGLLQTQLGSGGSGGDDGGEGGGGEGGSGEGGGEGGRKGGRNVGWARSLDCRNLACRKGNASYYRCIKMQSNAPDTECIVMQQM